jgi:hypothetical protein
VVGKPVLALDANDVMLAAVVGGAVTAAVADAVLPWFMSTVNVITPAHDTFCRSKLSGFTVVLAHTVQHYRKLGSHNTPRTHTHRHTSSPSMRTYPDVV